MALPPITVQLSKFEQIEILRAESDAREEELRLLETKLKAILYDVEKRRYLQSIHGLFQECEPHPEMVNYQALCQRRETLGEALDMVKASLAALEAEAGSSAPPRSALRQPPTAAGLPGAAPVRRKFDSFDDFRSTRQGS